MKNTFHRCTNGPLTQLFLCADLEDASTLKQFKSILPDSVNVVYSDPPWNPGNATYWRTHAGYDRCGSYDKFLDAWVAVAAECIRRGATNVLTEQSANQKHCDMVLAAIKRNAGWDLPFRKKWRVFYGSPGSASVRHPNVLLHFGLADLRADPSDMAGEAMTIRVCSGLHGVTTIVDPCMGKGMVSRMAHYFGWNCYGIELNRHRLQVTLKWLSRQGYKVREVAEWN